MDCSPPGSSVHEISQQEHWSGLPCPPPGDLPDPGIDQLCLLKFLDFRWILYRWTTSRCQEDMPPMTNPEAETIKAVSWNEWMSTGRQSRPQLREDALKAVMLHRFWMASPNSLLHKTRKGASLLPLVKESSSSSEVFSLSVSPHLGTMPAIYILWFIRHTFCPVNCNYMFLALSEGRL